MSPRWWWGHRGKTLNHRTLAAGGRGGEANDEREEWQGSIYSRKKRGKNMKNRHRLLNEKNKVIANIMLPIFYFCSFFLLSSAVFKRFCGDEGWNVSDLLVIRQQNTNSTRFNLKTEWRQPQIEVMLQSNLARTRPSPSLNFVDVGRRRCHREREFQNVFQQKLGRVVAALKPPNNWNIKWNCRHNSSVKVLSFAGSTADIEGQFLLLHRRESSVKSWRNI